MWLTPGVLCLAVPVVLRGQSPLVPRDRKGLELVRRSEAALINGGRLDDGVLQGHYKFVFKLMGEAYFSADAELEFAGERRSRAFIDFDSPLIIGDTEICSLDSGGETISGWTKHNGATSDNTSIKAPGQGFFANCWSAPTWFFPAMTIHSINNDQQIAIVYEGRHSESGHDIELLRTYRLRTGIDSTIWQNLTVSEIQLDRKTLLPILMKFWRRGQETVPVPTSDTLSAANNPVEVRYSDYRKVEGILVPFTVNWTNHGTMLDSLSITIQTVRLNIGLGPADFVLPEKLEPKQPTPCN
jgi:hypothetical protein